MEPMQELEHPTEEALEFFLASKLASEEVRRIVEHLDECSFCERRLNEMEPALAEYRACSALVFGKLRAQIEWPDLRIEPVQTRRRGRVVFAWLAAAAAGVLLTIAAVNSYRRGEAPVRAETLLKGATNNETILQSARLRVKTRTTSLVRPAILRGAAETSLEERALRSRFAAARYDWVDPLSPGAYSRWRNSLTEKTDSVSVARDPGSHEPREYTVRTTSTDSTLREATLTLTAALAPVKGTFLFADREWVEITVIDDAAPMVSAPPERLPASRAMPAPLPSPVAQRELKVRLALEAAYSSEQPAVIDVQPDGDIVVTLYRSAPETLRVALEAIPGVTFHSPDRPDNDSIPAPTGAGDLIIDTSQAINGQAGLLNQLSERFGAGAEATLDETARQQLRDLRIRHLVQLDREIENLLRLLKDDHPGFSLPSGGPAEPSSARAVLKSAQEVNRLVTSLYAADSHDGTTLWPQLASELSRLQQMTGEYARSLSEVRQ
jgi:hypothetical protein